MNLNLFDENLNRILIIGNQYLSCLWAEGYNTMGSFSLELARTAEYAKKVKPGCYVCRTDRKTVMVITSVFYKTKTIEATGKPVTRDFGDVAFLGKIAAGSNIDTAIINAYNNSTKAKNISFVSSGLADVYDEEVANKSILELCEIMCKEKDVGFKVEKYGNELIASTYKPERNPNLVFSEAFGNLSEPSTTLSTENYKNYAIVIGRDGVFVNVDWSNGEQRREIIVDKSSLSMEDGETEEAYEGRLYAIGVETLIEKTKVVSCAFLPFANDFGTRYDLGDIMTVILPDIGLKLQARVSKFTQKSQKNKTQTTVQVGEITILR